MIDTTAQAGAGVTNTRRQQIMAVTFSCLGWAFDMFDLFIFLYTAPILARVFFGGQGHSMLALAGVYASFVATLVMRPLGGTYFGQLADKIGRKRIMIVTTMGIGIATALTGCVPGYATWGLAGSILFIIVRLGHGIFMGGVVASTHTLGTESIPQKWRGLASGIIAGFGSCIGKVAVTLIFIFLTTVAFPGPAFEGGGWRVLYICGLASTLLSLLVFATLKESPMWENAEARTQAAARPQRPLRDIVAQGYLPGLVLCIILTLAGSGLTYLTAGYLATVLRLTNTVSPATLPKILFYAALAGGVASIIGGYFSDTLGRRRASIIYGSISLVVIPILYLQYAVVANFWVLVWLTMLITMAETLCYAPILIILNERFATTLRATGTSIAWNLGYALGGTTTIIVPLIAKTPALLPQTLAIFTAGLSLIYIVSVIALGKPRGEMATAQSA